MNVLQFPIKVYSFEKFTRATPDSSIVYKYLFVSTALGTKNDNFVRCPQSALDWKTRRFRMLEEIALSEADVICLQVPTLLSSQQTINAT